MDLNKELNDALAFFGIDLKKSEVAPPVDNGTPNPFEVPAQQAKEDDLKKSIDNLTPESILDIIKASNIIQKFDTFSDLIKSQLESFDKRDKENIELIGTLKGDLKKSEETINNFNKTVEEISSRNKELAKDLELIKELPLSRKSATADHIEKSFGKENDALIKGENNNVKQIISVSKQPKAVLNALEARMENELQKGETNGIFTKATMVFEASKQVSKDTLQSLLKEGILVVE